MLTDVNWIYEPTQVGGTSLCFPREIKGMQKSDEKWSTLWDTNRKITRSHTFSQFAMVFIVPSSMGKKEPFLQGGAPGR